MISREKKLNKLKFKFLTFSPSERLLVVEVPIAVVDPIGEGQQVVVDGQQVLVATILMLVTHYRLG